VINTTQMVMGVTVGCVFIVLGLVPGLIQELADHLSNTVDLLLFQFPLPSRSRAEFEQPRWFALVGATLIVVTLLLYLAN
jgi:hypothetical protein